MTVQEIKTDLRISHTKLDGDITATMAACKLDLETAGVKTTTDDALIDMAVKLYCRWKYDHGGKGPQHYEAYKDLKDALSMCGKYNGGAVVV